MDLDDATLMQRVQRGRLELFDELVARYRGPLTRVARSKLGDDGRAEDVVQETFLAVFAARHTYKAEFAFRTWLWTILLNLCRRRLKTQASRPAEVVRSAIDAERSSESLEPVTHESALDRLLQLERREQLAALLEALPEVQADALRLRFFGGLKFEEIAETMHSSLSAAKVRVRKGLAALAESLRREEDHR